MEYVQDHGPLIVLEGLDGCGKSTQFEKLSEYFYDHGLEYKAISFPDYNQPSSALVKMYLNGDISKNVDDINAYAASSFYAVDRYVSFKKFWENDYKMGKTILAARYTTSNLIYQMTKLPRDEWESFMNWLGDYEYNKLGLPMPDKVIFLDMPTEISQKLMTARYNNDESKKDIHECNVEYLEKCRDVALFAANRLGWVIIDCSDGDKPKSILDISYVISQYSYSYIVQQNEINKALFRHTK